MGPGPPQGCDSKTTEEERMKEPYDEGVATHIDPESCAEGREVEAKR